MRLPLHQNLMITEVVGERKLRESADNTVFPGPANPRNKDWMLWSSDVIRGVLEALEPHRGIPLVVDTVMVATVAQSYSTTKPSGSTK